MIINNRNCNIFTFDLKNNNYYYIETGHLYNFNGMKSYVSDQQLTVTVICRTSIESLNGTVIAVHTALSGILTMLQSSQLATEQRNCLRDTFKCCICRGDVNFLHEFIS